MLIVRFIVTLLSTLKIHGVLIYGHEHKFYTGFTIFMNLFLYTNVSETLLYTSSCVKETMTNTLILKIDEQGTMWVFASHSIMLHI